MIDIIPGWDIGPFSTQLDASFRLRHRVFKERLGWDVISQNGLEKDQFDTRHAIYLLAIRGDEEVVGMIRLLPTTKPYMLRDIFSELLEGQQAPCTPQIWEASRYAVDIRNDKSISKREIYRIRGEILCGMFELGMYYGINSIISVHDINFARLLSHLGITVYSAGKFHQINKVKMRYMIIDTGKKLLNNIRRASGIAESVIRYAPWNILQNAA